jgi:hypothetical protein
MRYVALLTFLVGSTAEVEQRRLWASSSHADGTPFSSVPPHRSIHDLLDPKCWAPFYTGSGYAAFGSPVTVYDTHPAGSKHELPYSLSPTARASHGPFVYEPLRVRVHFMAASSGDALVDALFTGQAHATDTAAYADAALPAAVAYLRAALRVIPAKTTPGYRPGLCGPADIPAAHQTLATYGADPDTVDFTLYVVARELSDVAGLAATNGGVYSPLPEEGLGTSYAKAQHCQVNNFGRPVAGYLQFSPSKLGALLRNPSLTRAAQLHFAKSLVLQEVAHTLGLSTNAYSKWRLPSMWADPANGIINTGPSNPVQTTDVLSKGNSKDLKGQIRRFNSVRRVITPLAREAARAHFGCAALGGVELEGDGNTENLPAASFLEARVYGDALMTRTLYPAGTLDRREGGGSSGNASYVPSPGASNTALALGFANVTLAMFADTGWYTVANSAVNPLRWGRGAGCPFAENSCIVPGTAGGLEPKPLASSFCQPLDPTVPAPPAACDARRLGPGKCAFAQLGGAQKLATAAFRYFEIRPTPSPAWSEVAGTFEPLDMDHCPVMLPEGGDEADCRWSPTTAGAAATAAAAATASGTARGLHARCFISSLATGATAPQPAPRCHRQRCIALEGGGWRLRVQVLAAWFDCPIMGGAVVDSQLAAESGYGWKVGDLICPDAATACDPSKGGDGATGGIPSESAWEAAKGATDVKVPMRVAMGRAAAVAAAVVAAQTPADSAQIAAAAMEAARVHGGTQADAVEEAVAALAKRAESGEAYGSINSAALAAAAAVTAAGGGRAARIVHAAEVAALTAGRLGGQMSASSSGTAAAMVAVGSPTRSEEALASAAGTWHSGLSQDCTSIFGPGATPTKDSQCFGGLSNQLSSDPGCSSADPVCKTRKLLERAAERAANQAYSTGWGSDVAVAAAAAARVARRAYDWRTRDPALNFAPKTTDLAAVVRTVCARSGPSDGRARSSDKPPTPTPAPAAGVPAPAPVPAPALCAAGAAATAVGREVARLVAVQGGSTQTSATRQAAESAVTAYAAVLGCQRGHVAAGSCALASSMEAALVAGNAAAATTRAGGERGLGTDRGAVGTWQPAMASTVAASAGQHAWEATKTGMHGCVAAAAEAGADAAVRMGAGPVTAGAEAAKAARAAGDVVEVRLVSYGEQKGGGAPLWQVAAVSGRAAAAAAMQGNTAVLNDKAPTEAANAARAAGGSSMDAALAKADAYVTLKLQSHMSAASMAYESNRLFTSAFSAVGATADYGMAVRVAGRSAATAEAAFSVGGSASRCARAAWLGAARACPSQSRGQACGSSSAESSSCGGATGAGDSPCAAAAMRAAVAAAVDALLAPGVVDQASAPQVVLGSVEGRERSIKIAIDGAAAAAGVAHELIGGLASGAPLPFGLADALVEEGAAAAGRVVARAAVSCGTNACKRATVAAQAGEAAARAAAALAHIYARPRVLAATPRTDRPAPASAGAAASLRAPLRSVAATTARAARAAAAAAADVALAITGCTAAEAASLGKAAALALPSTLFAADARSNQWILSYEALGLTNAGLRGMLQGNGGSGASSYSLFDAGESTAMAGPLRAGLAPRGHVVAMAAGAVAGAAAMRNGTSVDSVAREAARVASAVDRATPAISAATGAAAGFEAALFSGRHHILEHVVSPDDWWAADAAANANPADWLAQRRGEGADSKASLATVAVAAAEGALASQALPLPQAVLAAGAAATAAADARTAGRAGAGVASAWSVEALAAAAAALASAGRALEGTTGTALGRGLWLRAPSLAVGQRGSRAEKVNNAAQAQTELRQKLPNGGGLPSSVQQQLYREADEVALQAAIAAATAAAAMRLSFHSASGGATVGSSSPPNYKGMRLAVAATAAAAAGEAVLHAGLPSLEAVQVVEAMAMSAGGTKMDASAIATEVLLAMVGAAAAHAVEREGGADLSGAALSGATAVDGAALAEVTGMAVGWVAAARGASHLEAAAAAVAAAAELPGSAGILPSIAAQTAGRAARARGAKEDMVAAVAAAAAAAAGGSVLDRAAAARAIAPLADANAGTAKVGLPAWTGANIAPHNLASGSELRLFASLEGFGAGRGGGFGGYGGKAKDGAWRVARGEVLTLQALVRPFEAALPPAAGAFLLQASREAQLPQVALKWSLVKRQSNGIWANAQAEHASAVMGAGNETLILPPFTLKMCGHYRVMLDASLAVDAASSSGAWAGAVGTTLGARAVLELVVVPSPLHVTISGGASRTVSRGTNILLDVSTERLLTTDPDEPGGVFEPDAAERASGGGSGDAEIQFTWTCVDLDRKAIDGGVCMYWDRFHRQEKRMDVELDKLTTASQVQWKRRARLDIGPLCGNECWLLPHRYEFTVVAEPRPSGVLSSQFSAAQCSSAIEAAFPAAVAATTTPAQLKAGRATARITVAHYVIPKAGETDRFGNAQMVSRLIEEIANVAVLPQSAGAAGADPAAAAAAALPAARVSNAAAAAVAAAVVDGIAAPGPLPMGRINAGQPAVLRGVSWGLTKIQGLRWELASTGSAGLAKMAAATAVTSATAWAAAAPDPASTLPAIPLCANFNEECSRGSGLHLALLPLPPQAMGSGGGTFTFRLDASDGEASVVVSPNRPPSGGSVAVRFLHGTESGGFRAFAAPATTAAASAAAADALLASSAAPDLTFAREYVGSAASVSAVGWIDADGDLPLQFAIIASKASTSSCSAAPAPSPSKGYYVIDGTGRVLRPFAPSSTVGPLLLPSGDGVTVRHIVRDAMGAMASADACVDVKPSPTRARRVALAHLSLAALQRMTAPVTLQVPSWRAIQLVGCAADAVAALSHASTVANATVSSSCNAAGVGIGCNAAMVAAAKESSALRGVLGSDGGIDQLTALLHALQRAFAADTSVAAGAGAGGGTGGLVRAQVLQFGAALVVGLNATAPAAASALWAPVPMWSTAWSTTLRVSATARAAALKLGLDAVQALGLGGAGLPGIGERPSAGAVGGSGGTSDGVDAGMLSRVALMASQLAASVLRSGASPSGGVGVAWAAEVGSAVAIQRFVVEALGRRMPVAVQADVAFAKATSGADGGVLYSFSTPALNGGTQQPLARRRALRGTADTAERRLAVATTATNEPPVFAVVMWKSAVSALRTYLGANGRAVHLSMAATDKRYGTIAGWDSAASANLAATSGSGGPVVFLSDGVLSPIEGIGGLDDALLVLSAGSVPWHVPTAGGGVSTASAVSHFRLASLPVRVELDITSCVSYMAHKNIAFRFHERGCTPTNVAAAGVGSRRCCLSTTVVTVAAPVVSVLPLGHGLGKSGSGADRSGVATALLAWDPRKDACAVWDDAAKKYHANWHTVVLGIRAASAGSASSPGAICFSLRLGEFSATSNTDAAGGTTGSAVPEPQIKPLSPVRPASFTLISTGNFRADASMHHHWIEDVSYSTPLMIPPICAALFLLLWFIMRIKDVSLRGKIEAHALCRLIEGDLRGTDWMTLSHFAGFFSKAGTGVAGLFDNMMTGCKFANVMVAPFVAPIGCRLAMSRPQRVVVMCAATCTAFGAAAAMLSLVFPLEFDAADFGGGGAGALGGGGAEGARDRATAAQRGLLPKLITIFVSALVASLASVVLQKFTQFEFSPRDVAKELAAEKAKQGKQDSSPAPKSSAGGEGSDGPDVFRVSGGTAKSTGTGLRNWGLKESFDFGQGSTGLVKLPRLGIFSLAASLDEACVICQGEIGEGAVAKVLPCGHPFHKSCVDGWVTKNEIDVCTATSRPPDCPTCKKSLIGFIPPLKDLVNESSAMRWQMVSGGLIFMWLLLASLVVGMFASKFSPTEMNNWVALSVMACAACALVTEPLRVLSVIMYVRAFMSLPRVKLGEDENGSGGASGPDPKIIAKQKAELDKEMRKLPYVLRCAAVSPLLAIALTLSFPFSSYRFWRALQLWRQCPGGH